MSVTMLDNPDKLYINDDELLIAHKQDDEWIVINQRQAEKTDKLLDRLLEDMSNVLDDQLIDS